MSNTILYSIVSFIFGSLLSYIIAKYFFGKKNRKEEVEEIPIYSISLSFSELAELIKDYLDQFEWKYVYEDDVKIFHVEFEVNNEICTRGLFNIAIGTRYPCINFEILLFNKIPDNAVSQVAEFITRMNAITFEGFYIFNYTERYCIFRTQLTPLDQPFSNVMMHNCVVNLMNHHKFSTRALYEIIENKQDPLLTYLSLIGQLETTQQRYES